MGGESSCGASSLYPFSHFLSLSLSLLFLSLSLLVRNPRCGHPCIDECVDFHLYQKKVPASTRQANRCLTCFSLPSGVAKRALGSTMRPWLFASHRCICPHFDERRRFVDCRRHHPRNELAKWMPRACHGCRGWWQWSRGCDSQLRGAFVFFFNPSLFCHSGFEVANARMLTCHSHKNDDRMVGFSHQCGFVILRERKNVVSAIRKKHSGLQIIRFYTLNLIFPTM